MAGKEIEEDTWEASQSLINDPDIRVFLTTKRLDSVEFIEFVKSPLAGAIIYFGGTTRNSFESKQVIQLSYEAHKQLALRSLVSIAKEAKLKFEDKANDKFIHKIIISHRLGIVPVMEDSVIISLSSTHRQEGWEAAIHILEEIKSRVEIWKSEVYKDGTSSWKENENSSVV